MTRIYIGSADASAWRNEAFCIRPVELNRFNTGFLPGWVYRNGSSLELNLPFDWDEHYKTKYRQLFEPSRFFKNVVTICAALPHAAEPALLRALLDDLVGRALEHSVVEHDVRFCRYNFRYQRVHGCLEPGWVGGIGNGFVLAGLMRIHVSTGDPAVLALADEYLRAFARPHQPGQPARGRWVSWVDENGFLWFDEYPGDDGVPTLVLNGHIHALYGIVEFVRHAGRSHPSMTLADTLLSGALSTVLHNGTRFRRPGNINRYSLREANLPDYLPDRTVRQQRELYWLTGNRTFLAHAELFAADLAAHRLRLDKRERSLAQRLKRAVRLAVAPRERG
jgi:hypothetical protein